MSRTTTDIGKKFWGPATWRVIHDVSLRTTREEFFRFLEHLTHLLPCAECRLHLTSNIHRLSQMMGAEKSAFVGGYMLHNMVTSATSPGGPPPPSMPEVRKSLASGAHETMAAYVQALSSMAWAYVPSEAAANAYMAVYQTLPRGAPGPPLYDSYLKSKVHLLNWTFLLQAAAGCLPADVASYSDYKRYIAGCMEDKCETCALD